MDEGKDGLEDLEDVLDTEDVRAAFSQALLRGTDQPS